MTTPSGMEVALSLVSLLFGELIRRIWSEQDAGGKERTALANKIEQNRIDLAGKVEEHRVFDAATYATKTEMNTLATQHQVLEVSSATNVANLAHIKELLTGLKETIAHMDKRMTRLSVRLAPDEGEE